MSPWIFGALTWLAFACGVGVVIGKGIKLGDDACCPHLEPDEDWLNDQPVECLAQSEVDRRFTGLTRTWDL